MHTARILLNTAMFWLMYWSWTLGCMLLSPLPWGVLILRGHAPDRAMRKLIWVYARGCVALVALFASVEFEDRSDGATSSPAIVVANHSSFIDMHCLSVFPLDNVGSIVRSWPFKLPGFGFFMRIAGYMDRESLDHTQLLEASERLLERRASVVFFPEGTRATGDTPGRFRTGAFHLAKRTACPVIPVAMTGTGRFLGKGTMFIRPASIRITALAPVDPADFDGPTAHIDMMKSVKEQILKTISQHNDANRCTNNNTEVNVRKPMARFTFFLTICLMSALLLVTGCRKAPIKNVLDAPIADNEASQKLSMDKVERSIITAGASLGWKIHKISDGMMEGVLDIRRHQAIVSIPYNQSTYSIEYKNSTNLKYDGTKIHSNYNGWIQNLDQAIQEELSRQLDQ